MYARRLHVAVGQVQVTVCLSRGQPECLISHRWQAKTLGRESQIMQFIKAFKNYCIKNAILQETVQVESVIHKYKSSFECQQM